MDRLLHFLNTSPTPFHAVEAARKILAEHGFQLLREEDPWVLAPGSRYVVTRSDASLVAFTLPTRFNAPPPLLLAAAHTDSPTLKVKPNPLKRKKDYLALDLMVYGGALLSTWFDRDLSLAGRVYYLDHLGTEKQIDLDMARPVTRIPNLAIHLQKSGGDEQKINPHEELSAPFQLTLNQAKNGDSPPQQPFIDLLVNEIRRLDPTSLPVHLLAWDLQLYDTQPARLAGVDQQWIVGSRLDNLLSVYATVVALARHAATPSHSLAMIALFDHEETGSLSMAGAAGNFLQSLLLRIYPDGHSLARAMPGSLLLSLDNAHGYHPNYPARQDENHAPHINGGVVVKHHAGQRYVTQGATAARIKVLAARAAVSLQDFTVRADMPCGSTVGPTLSARLGIPAVDLGLPSWAMHSVRETAGCQDMRDLLRLLEAFFAQT
ncbi:MAG: M18 family aminopeptidase [Magnetococcales bacterium]|nr:M18 family aminopeptidase [Magnetococcales bacterium]